MRALLLSLAFLLGALRLSAAVLDIVHPAEGKILPSVTNVYCMGSADATNGLLVLNAVTTTVYHTGAFLAMVPVKPGTNTIRAVHEGAAFTRTFVVRKPAAPGKAAPAKKPPRDPFKDLGLPRTTRCKAPPYGKSPSAVRVMIDAGHGGADSGARSPHGWGEKEVNLLVSLALGARLRALGFQVLFTRETDTFPLLYDRPRAAIATEADLFISVHHNATAADRDPREVRHVVTYASNSNGLALAACIQKHLAAAVPIRDAGAQTMSLAVCRNPAVPSCLLEVDFINCPEGEEASWEPARHARVAEAVARGVLDWMTPPARTAVKAPSRSAAAR